jgi:hypothetical protein
MSPSRFVTASPRRFDYGSFLIQAVIARRNDEAINLQVITAYT